MFRIFSFIFLNIYFVASLIISGFPAQAQFCLDWPQNQSVSEREREWEKSNKLSMSLFVIFVYATGASQYVDRYFSRYFHAGDGILSNLKLANNAFELVKLKVWKSVTPHPLSGQLCALLWPDSHVTQYTRRSMKYFHKLEVSATHTHIVSNISVCFDFGLLPSPLSPALVIPLWVGAHLRCVIIRAKGFCRLQLTWTDALDARWDFCTVNMF